MWLGPPFNCQDIGFAGHRDVAASIAGSLPVPVVQFCGITLFAVLLMAAVPAAVALWFVVLKAPRPLALAAFAGLCLSALVFPYIASSDPYAYAYYGYETTAHIKDYSPARRNEPANNAALKRLEQLFPTGSSVRTPNYGPVALAEYALIAKIAGPSLERFIMTARVCNLLLVLTCGFLCALAAPLTLSRWKAFAYFANPLVLMESVAFVHSDILMIALLLAALIAYKRGRLAVSAAMIASAMLTRSIAGMAFIPLIVIAVPQRGLRGWTGIAAGAGLTLAVAGVLSYRLFGGFGLGGSPAIEVFSSPASIVLSSVLPANAVLVAGATCQAIFGLGLTLVVVARRRYSFLPLSALTILPMVRSWYAQWAVPLLSISDDVRARRAAAALTFTAIFSEWPELTGHTDRATWAVILLVQWGCSIAAALAARA